MRALSLRQPWAWLVVHGGKGIENRRWHTPFRGRFLIHAAKGMTLDEYEGAREMQREVAPGVELPRPSQLQFGGIIGSAVIEGVQEPGEWEPGGWHMRGQFGFLLADVRALSFVPCRGMLGFWRVPADVLKALREVRA